MLCHRSSSTILLASPVLFVSGKSILCRFFLTGSAMCREKVNRVTTRTVTFLVEEVHCNTPTHHYRNAGIWLGPWTMGLSQPRHSNENPAFECQLKNFSFDDADFFMS